MFGVPLRIIILQIVFLTYLFAKPLNNDQCDSFDCSSNEIEINKVKIKIPNNSIKPTPQQLCEACNIGLPIVRELIVKNKTEHFESVAIFICNEFKIVDPTVCSLAVKEYELVVLSIIKDSPLSIAELCDIGLDCGTVTNPVYDWNITLPNTPKPPVVPPTPPTPGSPTVRILHFSDLHIDFEYQPGAVSNCLDPLCCRNQSTPPEANITRAGYWGDYGNCDVPLWTVENMFDHISKNEEFDFIYWTGDLPPHNVWNQTKNDQLAAISHLSQLFLKYFPTKIVYPTLGNHEAAPCNIYPPPYVKEDNITWLYSAIATNWTATGLPESLAPMIADAGFYTIPVSPGLRLISLNMNYCPSGNYWLIINATDPLGQLEWLASVLQHSEDIGEKVHIIGHIEPGSCMLSWSSNYYRIVNRYENTITGQFFGHSHSDQFKMFYDLQNNTRAISVAYIAPSVTTYSYLNPGYRVYTLDGFYNNSSFQVLDHETRFLNLTDANISNLPKWTLEYTAKNAFQLKSVYPEDWGNLLNSILNDLDGPYFEMLYKFYYKSSDAIDYNGCKKQCKINFICDLKQSRSDDHIPCP